MRREESGTVANREGEKGGGTFELGYERGGTVDSDSGKKKKMRRGHASWGGGKNGESILGEGGTIISQQVHEGFRLRKN